MKQQTSKLPKIILLTLLIITVFIGVKFSSLEQPEITTITKSIPYDQDSL